MNLADIALRNRTVTLVFVFVMVAGGWQSYNNLSRLEDPEFTIKDAVVVTPYPGASAAEVQEEVTEHLERAVQQLGQLRWIRSKSDRGMSTLMVTIKDQYDKHLLPQVWDELRRKINDAQDKLPPGAGPSIVNDDFGDVYGVLVAITGPEFSRNELRKFAEQLQREFLLVQDVAKVDIWGERKDAIYIEPDRERMAQLGIDSSHFVEELRARNLVTDAGRIDVGTEFIAVEPTGTYSSVQEFESLLIRGAESGNAIYLRDIATVRRDYVDPPQNILRFDGQSGVALAVSTVSGGNVVVMGDALYDRAQELLPEIPLGIEFGIISLQSTAVTQAIEGFSINLAEAVVIVVVVLLFFMGLRSGLIIGFVLFITIMGTFPFLGPMDVALERISLGALIIALGMLVDNAIVVVDGILVRMQAGRDPSEAAREVVGQTSIPLLGATAVAVMAFAAIGTSDDGTGEYCRSLFVVVLVSLSLSWVTAMTVTPVLCVMFLRVSPKKEEDESGGSGGIYGLYEGFLRLCLRLRGVTVAVVLALFAVSLYGFGFVQNTFFPDSTRPQFMLDVWLPQGTHLEATAALTEEMESYLLGLEETTHVTTFVGSGGPRFLLTYAPEQANTAYAQFLVDVEDARTIERLTGEVEDALMRRFPDATVAGKPFRLGPGEGGRIQLRIGGPDPDTLRRLQAEVVAIMEDEPLAKGVRADWMQRVKVIHPIVADEEASRAGITRADIGSAVRMGFEGERIGIYREVDDLIPVIMRAPDDQRLDVASLGDLQIWSPAANQTIPIRQVVSGFETSFQDDVIWRRNRLPTITIHADPVIGVPPNVPLSRILAKVDQLDLPVGYNVVVGGEAESSGFAQEALAGSIPIFVGAMVLIVIMLFNSLIQPAVIFLCVPLALIGVTGGLLLTNQPFGFMSLLGFLSLSGMLIKNAIVLIDEIELQRKQNDDDFQAIVDSASSRLRPVAMAALTTALGMIPLLQDAFFVAMAVTIIAGLVVATVLTMVFVPVLYAIFFRIPYRPEP